MILIFKKLLKSKFFVIIFLILTILIVLIINYILKNSDNKIIPIAKVASATEQEQMSYLDSVLPIRIKIPSIKVDAAIEKVGLTKDGAMGAPIGPSNVGWFSLGVLPGEKGSSVMDGHFGWRNNLPAVFDSLNKVKEGDKIYIENNSGESVSFVVKRIKTYNPEADASAIFVSDDGSAHLNLITCAGSWNPILQNHSKRLVIFADKED